MSALSNFAYEGPREPQTDQYTGRGEVGVREIGGGGAEGGLWGEVGTSETGGGN